MTELQTAQNELRHGQRQMLAGYLGNMRHHVAAGNQFSAAIAWGIARGYMIGAHLSLRSICYQWASGRIRFGSQW